MFERDVFKLKIDHGLGAIVAPNLAALTRILSARAHAVRSTARNDPSYEGKVALLEEAVTHARRKQTTQLSALSAADQAAYPNFIATFSAANVTLRTAMAGEAQPPVVVTTPPAARTPTGTRTTTSPAVPPAPGKQVTPLELPAEGVDWGKMGLIGGGLVLAYYAWKKVGKKRR